MSIPSTPDSASSRPPAAGVTSCELHLAKAMVLIHRVLPRLEELDRGEAVQTALRQAASELTEACEAHERGMAALRPAPIEPEMLALIAAAVAVVLGRPHRVLGIEKVAPAVMWVNAWAMEGRFQHYSSHKVR